jgi:outer membrane immunogenic protein
MRKTILAAILLLVCTDLALAAKRAKKPPRYAPPQAYVPPFDDIPPPRSVPSWSGFYIGFNAGGGWAHTNSDLSFGGAPFATAHNSLGGALGGVQIGGTWQSGPAAYGVEADFQGTSFKGTLDAPTCPAAVCGVGLSASYSQKMPWFGTVRGRFGLASGSWLVYATGGYAYAKLETTASASAGAISESVSNSQNRSGWTAGGGIEIALDRNWSARMEYLHLDFGSADISWSFPTLPAITDRIRLQADLVRAGLNYRF